METVGTDSGRTLGSAMGSHGLRISVVLLAAAVIVLTSWDAEARQRHRHSRGFAMVLPAETAPDREPSPRLSIVCGRRHCRIGRVRGADPPSGFISDLVNLVAACAEEKAKFAPEVAQEVERRVKPVDAQRQAFSGFREASAAATETMAAGCPATMSPDPTARLDEAARGFERAADIAAPAIRTFYSQLDDEQKARISGYSPHDTADDADILVRTCATPPSIETFRKLSLTDTQRKAFEQAREPVEAAAGRLKTACPANDLLTPPRRLEAMRSGRKPCCGSSNQSGPISTASMWRLMTASGS